MSLAGYCLIDAQKAFTMTSVLTRLRPRVLEEYRLGAVFLRAPLPLPP